MQCVFCPSVRQSVSVSIGPFIGPSAGPSAGRMHRCLPVRLVFLKKVTFFEEKKERSNQGNFHSTRPIASSPWFQSVENIGRMSQIHERAKFVKKLSRCHLTPL